MVPSQERISATLFTFHTWSYLSHSSIVTSSPSSILHGLERDKQKGSLLHRRYLMSFRREENLPVNPLTDFPLYLSEVGHVPIPYTTRWQRRMRSAMIILRFREETCLPCSLLHVRYPNKSISKEKAGRGGSRVAFDEIDSL